MRDAEEKRVVHQAPAGCAEIGAAAEDREMPPVDGNPLVFAST